MIISMAEYVGIRLVMSDQITEIILTEELSYNNKNGDTVFTSQFLRNRKTCCQTACLHCPYGFTLKNEGLSFSPVEDEQLDMAQKLIDANEGEKTENVTASLLSGAFGGKTQKTLINTASREEYLFVHLKGEICALVKKTGLQASKIFLRKRFGQQGIDLDTVNSFL